LDCQSDIIILLSYQDFFVVYLSTKPRYHCSLMVCPRNELRPDLTYRVTSITITQVFLSFKQIPNWIIKDCL